jgi:hypothetical protein
LVVGVFVFGRLLENGLSSVLPTLE